MEAIEEKKPEEENGRRLKFVTVVGQMRSGTAAVANVLHMMGCTMGTWFVAPQPPTWRSDWEDADFNRLTFSKMPFGSNQITDRHMLQSRIEGLYAEYMKMRFAMTQTVAKQRFLDTGAIGVKHPFMLFVLPEWRIALDKWGLEPIMIDVRRPSYMIERSSIPTIYKKKGGKETQAALKELEQTYQYEYVCKYEEMIEDPLKVARELGEVIGITDEENINRAAAAVRRPTVYESTLVG